MRLINGEGSRTLQDCDLEFLDPHFGAITNRHFKHQAIQKTRLGAVVNDSV